MVCHDGKKWYRVKPREVNGWVWGWTVPAPTPTVPIPTLPPPPSPEAQIALRYIADKYGIPAEELVIANEHRREYKEIGRAFRAFALLELQGEQRFFKLMVDLKDHAVVEGIEAVEQAERDALQKRYGKLEPALYERLQKATGDELAEVAIWVAGPPRRSQEELFAELAQRFPAAREAMATSGKPFDVQDLEVRDEILRAYTVMLEGDTQQLLQPLADHLRAMGYAVKTYGSLPSVTARLPRQVILALAGRPDVGRVFLIEGEGQNMLGSAVRSDRVPPVWRQGFDGTGSSVAILEPGNVDFASNSAECPAGTNNCFRHPGKIRWSLGPDSHASLVASAAASDHGTYKGVAPGATIHAAGMTEASRAGMVDALKWALGSALDEANADVVNISYGFPGSQDMDWIDRAIDHWARNYFRMIAVAAGNYVVPQWDHWLISPAKAWDVVTMGAYNDHDA